MTLGGVMWGRVALRLWLQLGIGPTEVRPEALFPNDYVLDWNAPSGCPPIETIHARVNEMLTGERAGEGLAEVSANIETSPAGFVMHLTTRFSGVTDTRELTSSACADLAEATAVLLAVSLDPGLALEDPVIVPDPGTPAPSAPAPSARRAGPTASPPPLATSPDSLFVGTFPEAPPSTEATATKANTEGPAAAGGRRRPRLRGRLSTYGGVEYGALGEVTGAIQLGIGVDGPAFRFEAVGTYLTPRSQMHFDGSQALYQAGAAALRGCGKFGFAAWAGLACGGVEAGGLRVASRGIAPPRSLVGPFAGPSISGGVERIFGRVSVGVMGEIVGRAIGSRTVIAGTAAVEQFPVSFRLLAGIGLHVP